MLKIEKGLDNEILRKISKKINDNEIKNYLKLSQEMKKYIKNPKHGGVGLAAPQVGYSIRLIIVSLLKDWDDENYKTVIMFNPQILEFSDETECLEEGCLSVPNKKGEVERSKEIKLIYQNEKGSLRSLILEGLSARIVQHEVDHLNGILFPDKLKK